MFHSDHPVKSAGVHVIEDISVIDFTRSRFFAFGIVDCLKIANFNWSIGSVPARLLSMLKWGASFRLNACFEVAAIPESENVPRKAVDAPGQGLN